MTSPLLRTVLFASLSFYAVTFYALIAVPAIANADDALVQPQQLGRGVNIIGYDPLWQSREKGRFKERYFAMIKEAGFDHVRINLHPLRDHAMGADHQLSDAWLATLDWAVESSLKNHLKVILDFHEFTRLGESPEANKEGFLSFWRQVAARYANQPDEVVFEILNEPNKKLTPELWNEYLSEALAIIRESAGPRSSPGISNRLVGAGAIGSSTVTSLSTQSTKTPGSNPFATPCFPKISLIRLQSKNLLVAQFDSTPA